MGLSTGVSPSVLLAIIWAGKLAVLGGVGIVVLVCVFAGSPCDCHEGDMCTEGGGVCNDCASGNAFVSSSGGDAGLYDVRCRFGDRSEDDIDVSCRRHVF